jgi:hypothetical protein
MNNNNDLMEESRYRLEHITHSINHNIDLLEFMA